MLIKKLDDDRELHNKKIICIEKSEDYLRELKQKYPDIFENIIAIVDDYKREQGEFKIDEKSIPVYDISYLDTVNWEQCVFIITSDYYQQAFDNLKGIYANRHENAIIYYFLNKKSETEFEYQKKFANDELRDLLVFRSGPHESVYVKGMDFSDNARAFFEYLIDNGYNQKYEMVWFVKNPDAFKKYASIKNVYFYSFDWANSEDEVKRKLYYDKLYHAKYIFFTDAYGFARNCRKDQVRVQLWHGCGLKTRTNFVPCETRYEYNTVVSKKYAKLHEIMFGLRAEQVLATGHPKLDWLFHPVDEAVLQSLGIPVSDKYIFWLPTFRTANDMLKQLNEFAIESETGLPLLYRHEQLRELNQILIDEKMVMVIKLHPFQKKNMIKCEELSNIVLLDNEQLVDVDIHINQLLGWADALISDYSSVAIDYLSLNRPIAFTLDDVEEYKSSRGFHFDNISEWLPGKEIHNEDEYFEYVREIGQGIDSSKARRNSVGLILNNYSDDCSSKRIAEELKL